MTYGYEVIETKTPPFSVSYTALAIVNDGTRCFYSADPLKLALMKILHCPDIANIALL